MNGRQRLLGLAAAAVLPVMASGCVQPGSRPAPSPADQVAQRFLPAGPRPAADQDASLTVKKWVGRGVRDACGNPWIVEINIVDDLVFGTFWRGAIKYDISGNLKPTGNMERVLASKNRFFQHRVGPRLMEFNVDFGNGVARGEHYFANGLCLTPMQLTPASN